MQPRCRQVPPSRLSFSTMAVFSPSCPARIAATYPPGPEPMITTSKVSATDPASLDTVACGPHNPRSSVKQGRWRALAPRPRPHGAPAPRFPARTLVLMILALVAFARFWWHASSARRPARGHRPVYGAAIPVDRSPRRRRSGDGRADRRRRASWAERGAASWRRPASAVTVLERSHPRRRGLQRRRRNPRAQIEADGPGPFLDLCLRKPGALPGLRRGAARALRRRRRLPALRRAAGRRFDDAERRQARGDASRWQRALGLEASCSTAPQARALEPELSREVRGAAHFPGRPPGRQPAAGLGAAPSPRRARARGSHRPGARRRSSSGGRAVGVDPIGELLRRTRWWWPPAPGPAWCPGRSPPPAWCGRRAARWSSCRRGCRSAEHAGVRRRRLPRAPRRRPAHRRQHDGARGLREAGHRRRAAPRSSAWRCALCPGARRARPCRNLGGSPAAYTRMGCPSSGRPAAGAVPRHAATSATASSSTPITASVLAETILGRPPSIDLDPVPGRPEGAYTVTAVNTPVRLPEWVVTPRGSVESAEP